MTLVYKYFSQEDTLLLKTWFLLEDKYKYFRMTNLVKYVNQWYSYLKKSLIKFKLRKTANFWLEKLIMRLYKKQVGCIVVLGITRELLEKDLIQILK